MSDDSIDYLRELLQPLGAIRARRMFGAWGLYCNERFFALVADQRLYVKVDAESEPAFRAAGCEPFVYTGQAQPITLSYWSLPDEAFDSAEAMLPWARRAYDAAGRSAQAKSAARPKSKRR